MSSLFDALPACNTNAEGEALRDKALSLLCVRRADLIRDCTAAALRAALEHGEVCADDVRAVVPIPSDISPKLVGVVFRDLADAGILRRAGFRPSTRPAAHARPLSVWHLADTTAAVAWLAAHPPLNAD
jgi:hypothetical protein